jgi:hypothetical protein
MGGVPGQAPGGSADECVDLACAAASARGVSAVPVHYA